MAEICIASACPTFLCNAQGYIPNFLPATQVSMETSQKVSTLIIIQTPSQRSSEQRSLDSLFTAAGCIISFFVFWPGAPQWAKLRLPDLREQNLSWPSGQWKMGQLGTLLRGLTSLHGPCAVGSVDWSSKDFLITSSLPTVVIRKMKVLIWESCKCKCHLIDTRCSVCIYIFLSFKIFPF